MSSTPDLFHELSFSTIQEAFPSPHPAIGAEQTSLFPQQSSFDPSPSSSAAAGSASTSVEARPANLSRRPTAVSDDQTVSAESEVKRQRKRKRNFTNADRVVHSVIEKQRREAFNERLQDLADLIPELQELPTSQLFKTVVVNASATYHQRQSNHLETCLNEIEALQRRCANLQQTVSTLSGCHAGQLTGPSLSSSEFIRAQLEIRKDQAALQSASRARASSTSTTQSAQTETSEGAPLAALSVASQTSLPSILPQHGLTEAALNIPSDLFASSTFETGSSTNASFPQAAADADDLAALEHILPGLLPDDSLAVEPACNVQPSAAVPVPFPWESFSPGNFFYRQLLESRDRL